ncbi:Monosaccharide-sensing protein 2 [Bienertia sinuspersici]
MQFFFAGELNLLVEGVGARGEIVEPVEDLSWNARPVNEQTVIGLVSHHGSMLSQNLVGPLVTLFRSFYNNSAELQGSRSAILPNRGSMINTIEALALREPGEEEIQEKEDNDNLQPEPARRGEDSNNDLRTLLIHQSRSSENGIASQRSIWKALLEPGVKRALIVGIGIQMLQQFAGINGVLYYTPQILKEAGVEVLLSDLGISSTSSSFLISALTTLLTLPCIVVAMRLMDATGRRPLLLHTIPVLIASLVTLVISCSVEMDSLTHAVISTICVIVYFCTFFMAYGPIPNILCSEIFPIRVCGVCFAICALVFWICNIIVTYSLPVMLDTIGLGGVFAIYAGACAISFVFVYHKVLETKGRSLEDITERFRVGT